MADTSKQDAAPKSEAVERKRSPGFPTITLEEAIEKVKVLYDQDKGEATPPEVIATHWTTKTNSSTFMQDFASLKRYGLVTEVAHGRWKVSAAAVDILLLPDGDLKRARIKTAALLPTIHADIWSSNPQGLPSDANLIHWLATSKGFHPSSAKTLINQFKKTIEFAKLHTGDKIDKPVEDGKPEADPLPTQQGNSFREQAFQQFLAPKPKTPDAPKSPMQLEMKQDVFNLDEGQVVLQWPSRLSAASYEDLKDWMELQLRKIGRGVSKPPQDDDPAKSEMDSN